MKEEKTSEPEGKDLLDLSYRPPPSPTPASILSTPTLTSTLPTPSSILPTPTATSILPTPSSILPTPTPSSILPTPTPDIGSSFWEEFLEESRAHENCTILAQDGRFRTHKLLLYDIPFLRSLLLLEDAGDESVILLPDFSMEEVQTAMQYNTVHKNYLADLLDKCFQVLQDGKGCVKPEFQETFKKESKPDSERLFQYLTDAGRFQCDKCDKSFNAFRSLGKHLQQVHENEGLVEENGLEDTNVKISNIQSLANPEHENKKKRKRKEKKPDSEMEDFIVDESDEDEEEAFIRNLKLKKKREEKKKDGGGKKRTGGNCVCDYCGKGFSIQKYLDSHMTNKHPEKSEINQHIEEQNGTYKCMLCQKSFSIARRCRYHLKFKHKIGAKFSCDQCTKKFYYEYDLELHKRFHSAARNYVCDLCGKGFLLQTVLQSHKHNMHSTREEKEKNRKFVCSYCAKGFFSKSALQEHEFLHSDKKNFHCDMCGLSFKQSSGLRAHNNRHHSEAGPKPVTEEHKEKMRAYMKKYRAIKAGKLPDIINHSFRSKSKNPPRTEEPVLQTLEHDVIAVQAPFKGEHNVITVQAPFKSEQILHREYQGRNLGGDKITVNRYYLQNI